MERHYGTSYQQSINEVIASAFHKKQNRMPYTEYQLCDISTKKRNDIDYPNRGELIIKGFEQKVELLEKFQKGEKIYQKNFKKDKLL